MGHLSILGSPNQTVELLEQSCGLETGIHDTVAFIIFKEKTKGASRHTIIRKLAAIER